jgi:hypothetical protein
MLRSTKVVVANLDHNMLGDDVEINPTCHVANSLIGFCRCRFGCLSFNGCSRGPSLLMLEVVLGRRRRFRLLE